MINFEWKIDDVKFDICIGIESRWSMSLNLQVKIGNRNWLLLLIVLVWNCNFEGCYHIPIVKSRVSKCGWKSKTDFGYDSQRVWLKANTVNALKLAHVLEIEGLWIKSWFWFVVETWCEKAKLISWCRLMLIRTKRSFGVYGSFGGSAFLFDSNLITKDRLLENGWLKSIGDLWASHL